MLNTPYQNLAQAIIVKAAGDYRNALRGNGYGRYSASQVKTECERFSVPLGLKCLRKSMVRS